ncbi:MAG: hypothetical protein DRO39_03735 [Thermoprotei archaeon]|nr:MAG: hypothetical protein DRO39_03735 [Thermoprotei archaeon]
MEMPVDLGTGAAPILEPGVVYEMIATVFLGDVVNTSPLGITYRPPFLISKLYPPLRTLDMISAGARYMVVSACSDPRIYVDTLFDRPPPKGYGTAILPGVGPVPLPRGCYRHWVCRAEHLLWGGLYYTLYCRPIAFLEGDSFPKPYTRAFGALIEALVCLTRVRPFYLLGDVEKAVENARCVTRNLAIARRLGNELYRSLAIEVKNALENVLRSLGADLEPIA